MNLGSFRWCPAPLRETVIEAIESKRMSKIRSALTLLRPILKEQNVREFKLGIARTFTIETQIDAISLVLATAPCNPEIRIGDLENIEQSLLNPNSILLENSPDAVLVLWRIEDLYPSFVYESSGWSLEERKEGVESIITRIKELVNNYSGIAKAPLFLSTFPMPTWIPNVLSDLCNTFGMRNALLKINSEILSMAGTNQVYVFDFARWAETYGVEAFDSMMDFYARQPISGNGLESFAEVLKQTFAPMIRPASKVLALDLDGVLWRGILGESEVNKLIVGRDYPGNVYLRIQQVARSLKEQGVLLVLLSKNNQKDVEHAFETHPDMFLQLSDFVAVRANWQQKYQNLREIAKELNLGIDSFVFVDDQQFEQEEMRQFLPEVHVLPVSEDPLNILQTLTNCKLFDKYQVGEEDMARSMDYVNQQSRKALAETSTNLEEFLHSLHLEIDISELQESTLSRAVQMLSKTSQFNVTTRRHSESKVKAMMSESENMVLTLSMRDRFGDQGIIGLLIALKGDDSKTLHIDSFLLSCRAIGRGAEEALWAELLDKASRQGYRELTAEYIASSKNDQVADLFDRLRMEVVSRDDGHRQYRLDLPASAQVPSWFKQKEVEVKIG